MQSQMKHGVSAVWWVPLPWSDSGVWVVENQHCCSKLFWACFWLSAIIIIPILQLRRLRPQRWSILFKVSYSLGGIWDLSVEFWFQRLDFDFPFSWLQQNYWETVEGTWEVWLVLLSSLSRLLSWIPTFEWALPPQLFLETPFCLIVRLQASSGPSHLCSTWSELWCPLPQVKGCWEGWAFPSCHSYWLITCYDKIGDPQVFFFCDLLCWKGWLVKIFQTLSHALAFSRHEDSS